MSTGLRHALEDLGFYRGLVFVKLANDVPRQIHQSGKGWVVMGRCH